MRSYLVKPLWLSLLAVLFVASSFVLSESEPSQSKSELEGTAWLYHTDEADITSGYYVMFRPNGVLRSTHPNDNTPNNDHWRIDGDKVIWSFNDNYAVYTGRFTSDNVISGYAVNEAKKKWRWTLTKKK